jgi:hypothetical protein
MANYQQPNTDKPKNDPGVTIIHKIVNVTSPGPNAQPAYQQPNTANPVVDPHVGIYKLDLNPMNL